jgi:hypothetical protein
MPRIGPARRLRATFRSCNAVLHNRLLAFAEFAQLSAGIIVGMTQLDVLYRYGVPPSESATLAMARVREVYGVRRMDLDEANKTVRVEYDASRLTEPVIHQLLRRAGLDIVETIQGWVTPPPPEPVAAT